MKALGKKLIVRLLTAEAKLLLRRHNPTVIAITGSVGKTTTKDAIYAAIKDRVSARKSQKSFNSEIGVPLTILGLKNGWSNPFLWIWNVLDGAFIALFSRNYPAVLVLETGVDTPGDMQRLTQWLKPDVVVLTRLPNVPVHVEHFASPEAVVVEKMTLVHSMKHSGVLMYNQDDDIITEQLPQVQQTQVGYGRYKTAAVMVGGESIYYEDDRPAGIEFTATAHGESAAVKIAGVLGNQQLYAAAAAMSVAQHLGISLERAAHGLSAFVTPPGRMRVFPGLKGSVLIDDTYNSSPIAVEHALDTMTEIKHATRRIAVLGDMLELGKFSSEQHHQLGEKAARTCDVLFTVGVRARGFAAGALAVGMHEANIKQYEKADRAGRELQNLLEPGDLVLIKGSQSIRMERITEEVMAEPERAAELLPRQDAVWKTIR